MSKILVIDDEEYIGWIIKKVFEKTQNEILSVLSAKEALREIEKQSFDLVFLDLRLPDMDGMELLPQIKSASPDTQVIIITAHGSIDTAIESMKKGAFDYITKPFDVDELLLQSQKALELRNLKNEVNYLRTEAAKDSQVTKFISNNEDMMSIYNSIERIADTSATVLILGESGTGKELIARRIHQVSNRSNCPFIAINCGALPENLLESELFGYEKGAFTGAAQRNLGKFELADKGTIFLDEVGEMNLSVQVKFLRLLQEKEFQRIGGNSNIKVDVRIIAATNKNLVKAMELGEFREDLYYRLNVLPLELPPLRERKEDIPYLVDHFIKKYDLHNRITGISEDAIELLKAYNWPGNIRELENVIERIVILSKDNFIKSQQLPKEIFGGNKQKSMNSIIYFPEEGIDIEKVEKDLIAKALEISGNNQSKAAQLLNITRSALIYRMQKYGIGGSKIEN